MSLFTSIPPAAKNFIETHKHWLAIVGVAVLVFLLGFGTGKYLTPPKTVVTEKVQTVVQTQVVTQTQVQVKTVYVHDKQQDKKAHIVTVSVQKPDGTKTVTTTEDDNTDTTTHDDTNTDTNKKQNQTADSTVKQTEEKKTVVSGSKPQWKIGADVGLSLPYLISGQQIGISGLKGIVVQARGAKQLLGPLFMSVFGNTQGTVGVGLEGEF